MPGNPFKKPFSGGKTRATTRSPDKVTGKKTYVPRATSPIGNKARSVAMPKAPKIRTTTQSRKNVPMPSVRQGAQLGTPGKAGSRPGAKPH